MFFAALFTGNIRNGVLKNGIYRYDNQRIATAKRLAEFIIKLPQQRQFFIDTVRRRLTVNSDL